MKKREETLSPPWHIYANYIKSIFQKDPEVTIIVPEETEKSEFVITIKCTNKIKTFAISELLANEIQMGNITVIINCVYTGSTQVDYNVLNAALSNNPEVSEIVKETSAMMIENTFCVFKKNVIQFFDDNIGDINGNFSGLAEDISRQIFNKETGVFYCTSDK